MPCHACCGARARAKAGLAAPLWLLAAAASARPAAAGPGAEGRGFGARASFMIDDHRIEGMMIAAQTPMKRFGLELDLDVIPVYARFIAARNITNVMACGTNGESLSLSVLERKNLAEAWAKAAPSSGLQLYVHVGAESLVDARALAAHAGSLPGVRGLLAMAPVYFKPTLDTLQDFLAGIAAAAPRVPFWFYHFPDASGLLPGQAHTFLEFLDQTGRIPNLMGIKYTDYNLMDFSLCTRVGFAGKYNMLYGRDEQALFALLAGADAVVSSTIGFSPTLREAVALLGRGQQAAALAKQRENARLCSFFGAYESQARNVQKNIMVMVGMPMGPSRLPKIDLDEREVDDLQRRLRRLGLLDPEGPRGAEGDGLQRLLV